MNKSYLPTKVRFSQKGKWTTITVSNFKAAKLSDSSFTFKEKDYPNAEVIDLRGQNRKRHDKQGNDTI